MDATTLAYINLYAILGALQPLCRLSAQARQLVGNDRIKLAVSVKNGPQATLSFADGQVSLSEGCQHSDILLKFSSPEKFNGLVDGTVTPIPAKGLLKVKFLLKRFKPLTDLLGKYLRASEQDLDDPEFFRVSTHLLFHVISESVAQIANHDPVGRFSAQWIVDGKIRLAILPDGPAAYVEACNHQLTAVHQDTGDFLSSMEFVGLANARALFDGKVGALPLICDGKLRLRGMLSQIDSVNRILDRVGLYLA